MTPFIMDWVLLVFFLCHTQRLTALASTYGLRLLALEIWAVGCGLKYIAFRGRCSGGGRRELNFFKACTWRAHSAGCQTWRIQIGLDTRPDPAAPPEWQGTDPAAASRQDKCLG